MHSYHVTLTCIVQACQSSSGPVLEYSSGDGSSLHYFEGPEWQYLKRGRERFVRGPSVRADPSGRCAGVLVYSCQLVLLKAAQVGV